MRIWMDRMCLVEFQVHTAHLATRSMLFFPSFVCLFDSETSRRFSWKLIATQLGQYFPWWKIRCCSIWSRPEKLILAQTMNRLLWLHLVQSFSTHRCPSASNQFNRKRKAKMGISSWTWWRCLRLIGTDDLSAIYVHWCEALRTIWFCCCRCFHDCA